MKLLYDKQRDSHDSNEESMLEIISKKQNL